MVLHIRLNWRHKGAQLTLCLLCQQEVETVQILADALPKIVPYVLINHREVFIFTLSLNDDNYDIFTS